MENISKRIRAYRESHGITQREMAERMGVSSNYVYLIESERQEPSPSLVMLFERMEKDSIREAPQDFKTRLRHWRERAGHTEKHAADALGIGLIKYKEIETGRAPSNTTRAKFEELEHESPRVMEDIVSEKYNRIREESRAAGGLRTKGATDEARVRKVRKVPVIGWTQAGEAVAFEDVVDWDNVVSLEIDNPLAIAIRVKGDSMMPLIAEGDLVIVSPGDEPVNEKYVVAKLMGDSVVCKQFRRVSAQRYELRSLNPFYQPLIVEATEVVWIYPVAQLVKTSL